MTLGYRLSRRVHAVGLHAATRGFIRCCGRIFARWDRKPGLLSRMAHRLERGSKLAMYGCQDCGDCSLPDCAYLCPKKRLLEVRPQRALRRLGRRPLRVGRQGMFLGPRLRAAEVLRRVQETMLRPAGDDLQRRAQGHVVLGQYLSGPRPSRAGGGSGQNDNTAQK